MVYLKRIYMFIFFSFYYAWEMIVSNYRIFVDALSIKSRYSDQIVEIPIEFEKRKHLVILANLITLTPGTICVDYDSENKILSIHAMYKDDADGMREKIIKYYLPYVKEVFP